MLLDEHRTRPCHHCEGTGKEVNHVALGKKLRTIRMAAGKSRSEVARALGYSHAYLFDLEAGKRGWSTDLVRHYITACEGEQQ